MTFRKKYSSAGLDSVAAEQVHAEQVAIAYRNMRISSMAVFLNSAILTYVFWNVGNQSVLLNWFLLQLSIIGLRWFFCREYRLNYSHRTVDQWQSIFMTGMILSAIVWGFASILLFPADNPLYLSFLVIVLAGMSAGAVSSLSSLRYATQIYLTILILPLTIMLLQQSGDVYFYLASLILFYGFVLFVVAHRIHENIATALKTRILHEQALSELQITEERFETIFKDAPAGIFYYNTDLIVVETNSEMLQILKISREEMIGLDLKNLTDGCLYGALSTSIHGEKGLYEGPYTTMIQQLSLWINLRTSPIYDAKRQIIGGVGIVSDITERVLAEEKMKHQAFFDALTDIPNRVLLKDRIEQSLAHYRRHHSLIAIMFLDLDHFKSINDSLGHYVGDALLIETAMRLKSICREGDTVARLGGDEFVILLNELGNDPHAAATRAEIVAEKIHDVLSHPFDVGQAEAITTSSSIGIAIVSSDEHNADDLLKFADTAMYQAKKEGRNTTRFYQEQMDQWIKKRLFIENALRYAIKNGELELYYQPVIEIETKKIVGAEALLRWNHPEMGLVMPDEMIDVAEESGLIVPIGEWVLREACTQFVDWKTHHPKGSTIERIAINVSALQFRQNNFVDKVIQIVTESGIEPSMVEIELTESMIIDKMDIVIEKMTQLRAFGIGISMDDFGTGYSSLAYLKRLPFTTLKIDRSFIRDIMSDADDAVLVETILTMASIFNLDVIAEGVETIEQFNFLEHHKCRYFQGYLCSKPVQAATFEELLSYDIQSCRSHR